MTKKHGYKNEKFDEGKLLEEKWVRANFESAKWTELPKIIIMYKLKQVNQSIIFHTSFFSRIYDLLNKHNEIFLLDDTSYFISKFTQRNYQIINRFHFVNFDFQNCLRQNFSRKNKVNTYTEGVPANSIQGSPTQYVIF